MHHNVRAKRYQTNESGIWNQVERLLQRVLQFVHFLLVDTSINDKKKYRRSSRRSRLKLVFDCGKLWNELRRKILL
jgi:hypothetical protein